MITGIIVAFFGTYVILVCLLILGWRRALLPSSTTCSYAVEIPDVSVIIAARNESHNISGLLKDLRGQGMTNFEVIVIDDHSDDDTAAVFHEAAYGDPRFQIVAAIGKGKKRALTQAVGLSKGAIIITTDADCRVGNHWIESMSEAFRDPSVMFCFGAVSMTGDGFRDHVQSIEFASLVGTGIATAALGIPTMCNGANLAYRKVAFEQVGGYTGNDTIASGDDEFLMRSIHRRFPQSIRSCTDTGALVTTTTASSISSFIRQRLRWAGKWRANTSLPAKLLALYILCFHLCMVCLPFALMAGIVPPAVGTICIAVKALVEAYYLISLRQITVSRWNWPAFVILQLAYSWYVVIIGFVSQFRSIEWKERRLSPVLVD